MREKEYFNKLEEKLDDLFPKGKCQERSQALVLFAFANICHRELLNKQKEEMRQIIKQRRLKIIDEENKQEMEKWWDKVLPRKGSLLRQLVDLELNK